MRKRLAFFNVDKSKIDIIDFKTTYANRTLRAPRGVTKLAGANAYAMKFANSPVPTARRYGQQ